MTTTSLAGMVIVVVTALTHIGDPVPAGLFGSLGPGLVVGLLVVVVAAVIALVRGRGLAVPVVVLGGVVQLAQAITYGVPTVMAAARHIGVVWPSVMRPPRAPRPVAGHAPEPTGRRRSGGGKPQEARPSPRPRATTLTVAGARRSIGA